MINNPFSPCHHKAHESNPSSDTTSSVEALLYTDADMTVTAVIDNPKVQTHTRPHIRTLTAYTSVHYCFLCNYCSTLKYRRIILIQYQYGDNLIFILKIMVSLVEGAGK